MMAEAYELSGQVPAATTQLKPEICRASSGNKVVVWIVRRSVGEPVFMRADRFPNENINGNRWVVYAEARKLYFWWRWSAEIDPSRMNLEEDRKNRPPVFSKIEDDYKYGKQRHWTKSAENPTVLPKIHWNASKGVDFTEGMTRTMWLIRNGAAIFPIETTESEAPGLNAFVGYGELKPQRLSDLWTSDRM